jgi:hypothetical protein
MLEPNNRLRAQSPEKVPRKPSNEDYTVLIKQKTPELSCKQSPRTDEPRRLSLQIQHRNAADEKTHPSRNFHLPRIQTRNAAHAEELLAVYCGRICEWGLATFPHDSSEARLLRDLTTLNILLQSSALARASDPIAFETEAHASAVLSLTREVMQAKDYVNVIRLSFEVDKHIYDIVDIVQCLHKAAVSTLLGLFLNT